MPRAAADGPYLMGQPLRLWLGGDWHRSGLCWHEPRGAGALATWRRQVCCGLWPLALSYPRQAITDGCVEWPVSRGGPPLNASPWGPRAGETLGHLASFDGGRFEPGISSSQLHRFSTEPCSFPWRFEARVLWCIDPPGSCSLPTGHIHGEKPARGICESQHCAVLYGKVAVSVCVTRSLK